MYATELDVPLAHQAAAQGNINELTRAIKEDPTVLEHQDTEGLTPLGHAVMSQQLESLKLLVKMGASINAQDQLGRTGLLVAAYQGWHEGVILLLRNGAKQSVVDKSGRTALHSATYPIETNVLGALLQNISGEDMAFQDNEGMTALHWACFHNRPKHAQLLLLKGVNPFLHDIDGRNALHWAAQNGSLACVTVLIHLEASPNLIHQADFTGKVAIHFAAAAGHCDVIQELVTTDESFLQTEDNEERTPLHWAAATGQTEAVRTLLDLGVDPHPVDVDEGTPLDYARQAGHWECVQILEEHLGLRTVAPSVVDGSTGVNSLSANDSAKNNTRKNPFGFIVDLFRPKHKSSITELSSSTTGHHHHRLQQQTNTHQQEISSEDLVSREATTEDECSEDLNCSNAADTDFSVTMVNIPPPQKSESASLPGSKLSTPVKRQRDSEVLRSMEMIHLSREDNPVLTQIRHSEQSLVPSVVSAECLGPGGGGGGHQAPPNSDSSSTEVLHHHHALVRSPPPVIKRHHSPLSRENSLSPVPSVHFPSRSDYSRAQIEQDAAQILALHSNITANSKAQGVGHYASTPHSHGESSPTESHLLLRSASMSEEEGSGRDLSKGRKIRLAPLRGPVPQSHSPGSPLVNKPLQMVKQGRTGENRPPTPPSQPSNTPLSSSCPNDSTSNDSSPKVNKRKKKRKSSSIDAASDNMEARDSNSREKPSFGVNTLSKDTGPSSMEQRKAIDKSIRNLLQ